MLLTNKAPMIIYSEIPEIFCLVDEFCKEYDQILGKCLLGNPFKRPPINSKSEVITISTYTATAPGYFLIELRVLDSHFFSQAKLLN